MQTMTIGEPVTEPCTTDSPAEYQRPQDHRPGRADAQGPPAARCAHSRRLARAGADSQAPGRCACGIHDVRNRSHADPEPGAFAPRVGASGATGPTARGQT